MGCLLCQASAQSTSTSSPPSTSAGTESGIGGAPDATANPQGPQTYTLSPQRARKAIIYAESEHALYFLEFVYGIVVLLWLLLYRVAARIRDWAEGVSGNRFVQALLFVPALLLTVAVLNLPGEIAGHSLGRTFGLSVQGWGSWAWDEVKGEVLAALVGAVLVWLLYSVMRRSPRRWWFYAWLGSLPIVVFFVFLSPLLIEPLFSGLLHLRRRIPNWRRNLSALWCTPVNEFPRTGCS